MSFKLKYNSSSFPFSTTGYRKDSPDVNNPYNIIPSGNITMEDVEFKVRGEDNLGNVKIMSPGKKYKFPGDAVLETPLKEAPPGMEHVVKALKGKKGVNPYAIAWSMYNKGQ